MRVYECDVCGEQFSVEGRSWRYQTKVFLQGSYLGNRHIFLNVIVGLRFKTPTGLEGDGSKAVKEMDLCSKCRIDLVNLVLEGKCTLEGGALK